MLVVTANWEIGDGTLWSPPAAGVVARFVAGVRRAAVRCGWRADATYAPVGRIDVVLAGDTFDWLSSQAWLGAVRPWHKGARAGATHDAVVAATLRRARGILAPLVRVARRGIPVPRGDHRGRPVVGDPVVAPVGLTMLSGNLDGGPRPDRLHGLASRLGVALGESWSSDRVEVRHGHTLDPLWCPAGESAAGSGPTLGALLRIDLVGRFAHAAAVRALDDPLRRRLLADLGAAHPLAAAALMRRWLAAPDVPAAVRSAWLASVEGWHRAARATGIGFDPPFDVIDALATRLSALDTPRRGLRPPRDDGEDDPLALALLPGPAVPEGAAVTTVVGHLPVAGSVCLEGARSVVGLGRDPARGVEEPLAAPAVREIGPPLSAVADPAAVVFAAGGARPWRGTALGEPVPEWEWGAPAPAPLRGRERGGRVVEAA